MTSRGRELRLLLAEDSEADAELLLLELRRIGYRVTCERVFAANDLRDALARGPWDLVVSDYEMPAFDALDALRIIRAADEAVPVIVVSGTIGEETAVATLQAGAGDFIVKGRLARLGPAIERELQQARIRTALRRSEEQLRHAQKMEAIGRLAGGIAHDFNNVLSVIMVYAEVMKDALAEPNPLREDVVEILKACTRASDLTRQLLTMSRQQVLRPRVVDMNAVVTGMDNMLRRVIGADVTLTTLALTGSANVLVDVGQIEQVILNLVINARDAMPSGGKLTIELASAELDDEYARAHVGVTPGPYVMLAVSDTGTGMDSATQERIFEPFFTTKEPGRGTGLGLATVFGIVKQSGGHVWVYSEVGAGTTFKVYLPRTDRLPSPAPAAQGVTTMLDGTETILLADDDHALRTAAAAVLRKRGYRVLEAAGGPHALRVVDEHTGPLHLLITDVVMPGTNGRKLAEEVRRRRPETKVLFVSGFTNGSVVQHGVLDARAAFLAKPITPDALLVAVRRALDGTGSETK